MKKFLVAIIIVLMVLLVTACIPEEPKDIPQFCKDTYAANPDYPPQFVGACISVLESGNQKGAAALCGWEVLWEDMGFTSRKECVQYFAHLKE